MDSNKGKFGASLVRVLLWPLSKMPLGFHRACGKGLGWLLGSVVRYRRDVVMTNLSRSFPDKKYAELSDICKRFYKHMGCIFTEAIWFGGCTKGKRLDKTGIVRMHGTGLLNSFLDSGKSVFVMYSHMGNWELIGGYGHYSPDVPQHFGEHNVCVIYRRLSSPVWDKFIARNRVAPLQDPDGFEGMIETFQVLRYILSHRNEPKLYNFNGDQFPYSSSSCVDVGEFMHQPTLSMDGAPALARKLGMPLVYMSMFVREDGGYDATFRLIAEDSSKLSVKELLQRYYAMLEADLDEQPWNYLWTHKRWK